MTSLALGQEHLQGLMNGILEDASPFAKGSFDDLESDTQLLLSMDREVKKYESLSERRVHLQKELDRSETGSPAKRFSPGEKSKSLDSNFNEHFLTAKSLSPATRSSMRSLVDSMSPLSRKVLLESLIEKNVHGPDDSTSDTKKKNSPPKCKTRKKSPSKRIKITPPRVKLSTSPSFKNSYIVRGGRGGGGRGGGVVLKERDDEDSTATLTMLDFAESVTNTGEKNSKYEKGGRYDHRQQTKTTTRTAAASPTEIAAQQLTAEIGTLEAELEKLIESKAERQAEEAESVVSEISDVSSEMMYSERTPRNSRNRRRKKGRKSKNMNQIKMNSFNGSTSIAGLGKAYGFGSTGNTGSNSGNNGNSHVRSRRRHGGKAKKMNKREKEWIVSGDRPPASDQRRFIIKNTSKRNTSKDIQKQNEMLAASMSTKTVFEYDEVQASKFVASAFGISPRTAHRTTNSNLSKKFTKTGNTYRNIKKGKVGFLHTTANQKLRELEILRRKMNTPKSHYSSAEDRVFFLHHR